MGKIENNPYFKGPSRERIEKAIVGMSLEERFDKAIENNVLWLVKQCLNDGVGPTVDDNTAIIRACQYGFVDIVKLLLYDSRILLDDDRAITYALFHASKYGNIEIIKEFLKHERFLELLSFSLKYHKK